MFEQVKKIRVNGNPNGGAITAARYAGANRQIFLRIPRNVIEAAGHPQRVSIHVGKGNDFGKIMLTPRPSYDKDAYSINKNGKGYQLHFPARVLPFWETFKATPLPHFIAADGAIVLNASPVIAGEVMAAAQ